MMRALRGKLLGVIMAIVTLLLCLIFVTVYQSTRLSLEREMSAQLHQAVQAPERSHIPWVLLQLDEAGQVTAVTSPGLPLRLGPAPETAPLWLPEEDTLQAAAQAARAAGGAEGLLPRLSLRYLWVGGPEGRLALADASMEVHLLQRLALRCILLGGLAWVTFLLLSLLLARWMLAPVERAWAQQRQFVADASHELKTPLTVIRTNAQLLQEPNCTPAEHRRFAENILTMSQQMGELVARLLELARLDSGLPQSGWQPVDFSRTVSDQALLWEPICFEAGLTLQWEIADHLTVPGSPAHLAQIPEILLDNAAKYAPTGSTVLLRLAPSGREHCLLTVSDPGEALSPQVRSHLFQRFYRADPARRRDGSYGLGLAIAQAVVSAHHGRIWYSHEEGRNVFSVRLPLSATGGKG